MGRVEAGPHLSRKQPAISFLRKVSRLTRVELASATQVTFGQSFSDGASNSAGPEPSSTKCACRVAAQFGIIATGRLAACAG